MVHVLIEVSIAGDVTAVASTCHYRSIFIAIADPFTQTERPYPVSSHEGAESQLTVPTSIHSFLRSWELE